MSPINRTCNNKSVLEPSMIQMSSIICTYIFNTSSDPSAEQWNPEIMCSAKDLMFHSLGGNENLDLEW